METDAPKAKVHKGKGITTIILDFDDSNDDIFYEEAENVVLLVLPSPQLM